MKAMKRKLLLTFSSLFLPHFRIKFVLPVHFFPSEIEKFHLLLISFCVFQHPPFFAFPWLKNFSELSLLGFQDVTESILPFTTKFLFHTVLECDHRWILVQFRTLGLC